MLNVYEWVSAAELEAAKQSGKKCCPMCRPYGVPGFMQNADQWVNCFQCNSSAGPAATCEVCGSKITAPEEIVTGICNRC
jgi:hypothetical protein